MANKYVYVIEVAHNNSFDLPNGTILSITLRTEYTTVEAFVQEICIGFHLKALWDKVIGWAPMGPNERRQEIILEAENTIEATFLAKTAYEQFSKK